MREFISSGYGSCADKDKQKNLRDSEEQDLHNKVSHQGYLYQIQVLRYFVYGEKRHRERVNPKVVFSKSKNVKEMFTEDTEGSLWVVGHEFCRSQLKVQESQMD